MFNGFISRPKADTSKIAAVREWVERAFALPSETYVTITELQCTEPGCPPLETAIIIIDAPGKNRLYKVHSSIADIQFDDIAWLVREPKIAPKTRLEPHINKAMMPITTTMAPLRNSP